MIRIFDALLSIARAEAGAGREGMIDFDASSVARDVGELYEPVAETRGIPLEDIRQPELYLHGSRELIGQALANLVDNALKYGSPATQGLDPDRAARGSSQRHRSNSRRRGAAAMIEIVVADRGPGIDATDRLRVIDRFVRLESRARAPGSGLGLSLAAAVARLHNGTLRIEDNEPGLRVVICLPGAPVRRKPAAPLALPRPDKAA